MRRFFKRLRKGLKTACLAAALTTCWGVGQIAQAAIDPPPDYGDEIIMHFTGTVSPAANDISHVYLIYGTGSSPTELSEFGAVKLGDFSAGQTTPFSVYSTAIYENYFGWIAVGLHGDISGGQYVEGLNGVTMAHPYINEGDDFNSLTYTDIDIMFDLLVNDDLSQLADEHAYYCYANYDFDYSYADINLWDFSAASHNGQISLVPEAVPEPISLVLFGGGWLLVVASRRQKH